jgi:Rieske Fe-S protein
MNFLDLFIESTPSLSEKRTARLRQSIAVAVARPDPPSSVHILHARTILKAGLLASLLMVAALLAMYAWPLKPELARPSRIITVGQVDDFPPGSVTHFEEQKFWLVRLESGEFIALSQKDPWRGCTIPWRSDFVFGGTKGWFRDPCVGSTYDIEGHRVFGPRPRDMDRYPIAIKGKNVVVDTRTTIPGPSPAAQGAIVDR